MGPSHRPQTCLSNKLSGIYSVFLWMLNSKLRAFFGDGTLLYLASVFPSHPSLCTFEIGGHQHGSC